MLVSACLRGRFGINCPSAFFEHFEIVRVKRWKFQNFQKS